MDEPSEIMAAKHRMYRHDPYTPPKEARALFGEYADQACLDHIRADIVSWRRQGLKPTRPVGKSEIPAHIAGLAFLFMATGLFIVGATIFVDSIMTKHGGWFICLALWFLAFLFFLGFLAALGTTEKRETEGFLYEIEMPPQYLTTKPENDKKNEETPCNKEERKDQ